MSPRPTSWRYILILSSSLPLRLSSPYITAWEFAEWSVTKFERGELLYNFWSKSDKSKRSSLLGRSRSVFWRCPARIEAGGHFVTEVICVNYPWNSFCITDLNITRCVAEALTAPWSVRVQTLLYCPHACVTQLARCFELACTVHYVGLLTEQ